VPDLPAAVHGGTGAGPPPRWDFSSNANPLGPGPTVAAALSAVDVRAYPDPAYTRLRERLGEAEGVDPEWVVVGGGASELVHRVVAAWPGPVAVAPPTFGEYAYAAAVHDRPLWTLDDAVAAGSTAFVGAPNNPDGVLPALHDLDERVSAAGGRLVVDLAYADLCERPVVLPERAWRLVSPTKGHGVPGVRAGYLVAPAAEARRLRERAPSWVLSAHGVALLAAAATPAAREEVRSAAGALWRWRDRLADRLERAGWSTRTGAATFLLVDVAAAGGGTAVTAALRERGLRVRDATSFGLPGQLRLAALGPEAAVELVRALEEVRACAR
jgi:histidinol-phosphate aminotransferase